VTDVSAILTAHAEGPLAARSLRSLLDAVDLARRDGLSVETLVVLDNPDPATLEALDDAERHGRVLEVSLADQGLVRNRAVAAAVGDHVAFLDGDDLWSENWLVEAHRMCRADPGRVIAHPEVNWFFGQSPWIYFLPDQACGFDPALMRVANPWDALCMAPAAAYAEVPFSERAIADGYAFEDWHWSLETFAAGFVHRVAPGTIHFKRRREGSQFTRARDNRSLTRPSKALTYAWVDSRRADPRPGADHQDGRARSGP